MPQSLSPFGLKPKAEIIKRAPNFERVEQAFRPAKKTAEGIPASAAEVSLGPVTVSRRFTPGAKARCLKFLSPQG